MANVGDTGGQGARGSPFWTFSLTIYRSPQVQAACLELQDRSGVDVNVLLFMLWLGTLGRELTGEEVDRVVEGVEPWRHDVVVPLRSVRRTLKEPAGGVDIKGAEALRLQVKRLELEAERLQQEALYAMAADGALGQGGHDKRAACGTNIAAYAGKLRQTLLPGLVATMVDAAVAAC